MQEINNSFTEAIDINSEAQGNITEIEWEKIRHDKDKILSGISDDKMKSHFENRYNFIDKTFQKEGEQILSETSMHYTSLKNIIFSDQIAIEKERQVKLDSALDFFGNNSALKEIQNVLEGEVGLDLTNVLSSYKDFIANTLKLPEGSSISKIDYKKFISNIKQCIINQLLEIKKTVLELREDNNGSLKNMQWDINTALKDQLSSITDSLFPSAIFYLNMSKNDISNHMLDKDKVGDKTKLYTGMRLREIHEGFIDEKIKNGDDLPTGLINNDSFWTADKLNNQKRDNFLIKNNKIIGEGKTIESQTEGLKEITFLNEKDKQIEDEAMIAMLCLVGACCIPYAGAIPSALIDAQDICSSEDQTIKYLKNMGVVDQNFHMSKAWYDHMLAAVGVLGSFIGLQAAAKSVKLAKIIRKIKSSSLSGDKIASIMGTITDKLGLSSKDKGELIGENDFNKVNKVENNISIDSEVFERINVLDKQYPEKYNGGDETILYRYANNKSGINESSLEHSVNDNTNGVGSFWHVDRPHDEYTSKILIKTTVGDLKKQGIDIRIDNEAVSSGENSISLVGIADRNLTSLPGERQVISGYGLDGKTAIVINDKNEAVYLGGDGVEGRWTGTNGNVYFGDENIPNSDILELKTIDGLDGNTVPNINDTLNFDNTLKRNPNLTAEMIMKNSDLNDADRAIGLRMNIGINDEQIQAVIDIHHKMGGLLGNHSDAEWLAKKTAMGKVGIDPRTAIKIMDYGYAGKFNITGVPDNIVKKLGINPRAKNMKLEMNVVASRISLKGDIEQMEILSNFLTENQDKYKNIPSANLGILKHRIRVLKEKQALELVEIEKTKELAEAKKAQEAAEALLNIKEVSFDNMSDFIKQVEKDPSLLKDKTTENKELINYILENLKPDNLDNNFGRLDLSDINNQGIIDNLFNENQGKDLSVLIKSLNKLSQKIIDPNFQPDENLLKIIGVLDGSDERFQLFEIGRVVFRGESFITPSIEARTDQLIRGLRILEQQKIDIQNINLNNLERDVLNSLDITFDNFDNLELIEKLRNGVINISNRIEGELLLQILNKLPKKFTEKYLKGYENKINDRIK